MLNQGGTFAGTILVARLLGQTAFGQYALIQSTLISLTALAQMGMAHSASKHIAEFRSIDKKRTGRILGLCAIFCPATALLFAVVVTCLAPFFAERALGSANLAAPLAIGSITIFFAAINSYQTRALIGLECYRALVAPDAIGMVMSMGGVAAGAILGGVNGAIAGGAAATMIRWYVHWRGLKNELRRLGIETSYRGIWSEVPMLYSFAIPATLSGYFMMPTLWFTNALLVQQQNGYGEMAYFSAAQTVRMIVMFIPLLMNSVGLSILNNVRRTGGVESYASVARMNAFLLSGLTIVSALMLAVCGPLILSWFGRDFADAAYPTLLILLAGAVLESMFLGFFQTIQSAGRMWLALLIITIPWQVTLAATAFFLVPRYGGPGLAASQLAGFTIALIATVTLSISLRRNDSSLCFP